MFPEYEQSELANVVTGDVTTFLSHHEFQVIKKQSNKTLAQILDNVLPHPQYSP